REGGERPEGSRKGSGRPVLSTAGWARPSWPPRAPMSMSARRSVPYGPSRSFPVLGDLIMFGSFDRKRRSGARRPRKSRPVVEGREGRFALSSLAPPAHPDHAPVLSGHGHGGLPVPVHPPGPGPHAPRQPVTVPLRTPPIRPNAAAPSPLAPAAHPLFLDP